MLVCSEDRDAPPFPAELLIWLSPAFPVGSFAYSQGIETAIAKGWITDAASLHDWLSALIDHGALRNDLIILSLIRRAPDEAAVRDLAELATALQPSKERAEETLTQGRAFMDAYRAGWADTAAVLPPLALEKAITLPVAVGFAARGHALPLEATLLAYATAFQTNLVSAAIRLGVIGQFDGQRLLAELLPQLRDACRFAISAAEDDLGGAAFAADLASSLHETQQTRLFRS